MSAEVAEKQTQVVCDSGIKGWRSRLQTNYDGNVDAWRAYAEMYGLASRLGYSDTEAGIEEAWEDNPIVQGSVIGTDYRKVKEEELTEEEREIFEV